MLEKISAYGRCQANPSKNPLEQALTKKHPVDQIVLVKLQRLEVGESSVGSGAAYQITCSWLRPGAASINQHESSNVLRVHVSKACTSMFDESCNECKHKTPSRHSIALLVNSFDESS